MILTNDRKWGLERDFESPTEFDAGNHESRVQIAGPQPPVGKQPIQQLRGLGQHASGHALEPLTNILDEVLSRAPGPGQNLAARTSALWCDLPRECLGHDLAVSHDKGVGA